MSERKPYPSDLSDEQWSLIEPVITAWKKHRSVSGHQGAYDMREIVNAILHQGQIGCQWIYLPHDLPQKSATYYYYYFAAWRDDGTDKVSLLDQVVVHGADLGIDVEHLVRDHEHRPPPPPPASTGR
ncbi:transposase [Streptomyces sp. NY05-11A]|nr:transposase [Streptomyces sp. NY05-11A]